jgi:hypothetical protein
MSIDSLDGARGGVRGRARPPLVRILIVVAALTLGSGPVLAQSACDWQNQWSCFGALEYRVHGATPVRFMRARVDTSFEVEGQVIEEGAQRRFLQVRPSGLTLFNDFVEKEFEAARGDPNFGAEFIETCLAPIAASLMARYREPRAVPEQDTTTEFEDAKLRVIIITSRRVAGTIAFDLIFRKPVEVEIEGNWVGPRRPPLPDDFDISEWKHLGAADLHKLGEARSLATLPALPSR